jgi:tripartite-type tricarboxylate transporter receptor subunit TctC
MTTRRTVLRGLAGAAAALAGPAFAQEDKSPITVLVGAASSMDFTARLIAEQLRQSLDRPAIVVSKLGAGQRLALGECKRAQPDGRTLVFATSGPFAIYPHVYSKLDYDPVADFTPIVGVSKFDVAVSTQPKMTGANTLQELVAWAKARKPGDAVFGSAPGNGSLSHFLGLSIGLATHTQLTHVAYKDSGVGLLDLASGRLPMMITGLQPQIEFHKAGKIKILAVSGDKRSPLVPDVPTLQEAGINIASSTSTGVFGPAGMSPELVKRIHDAIAPMLSNAETVQRLNQQTMTIWKASPTELASEIRDESQHFAGLVKASGFQRLDA